MRTIFFSFSFEDVFKANQVRKSGSFSGSRRSGFKDRAEYTKVSSGGSAAVKRWINNQMRGCSVTCVLIGRNTYQSKWVNYEIQQSIENKMGLLGIFIHKLKDPTNTPNTGLFAPKNPLDNHQLAVRGLLGTTTAKASEVYETYTWETGLLGAIGNELGDWVEAAARIAGR
ncbi:MAG: TIR domain-containing protein [Candidatus Thiodiazotropha sp.]